MPALHTETFEAAAPTEEATGFIQKIENVRHKYFPFEVVDFILSDFFVAAGYFALATYCVVMISSVIRLY